MTALLKYQRLECTGLWRESAEAQRREVAVSFGEASLVLSDPRSGAALTHWSLPAVVRRNSGTVPAVFGPDAPDGVGETLEIADPDMIEALETVQRVVRARRRAPTRMRLAILGGMLAALLGLGIFWLPDALIRHAAAVLPAAKRAELGWAVLTDIQAAGLAMPCRGALGQRALGRLQERLTPPLRNPRVVVLAGAELSGSWVLPGRTILIAQDVLERHDGPEVLAGHILSRNLEADLGNSMLPLLRHAGTLATVRLLTTGTTRPGDLSGYGARLLENNHLADLPEAALLDTFAVAGVPTSPYARALDPSGETTLALIEADPFRNTRPDRPLMTDGDWISLQGICSE